MKEEFGCRRAILPASDGLVYLHYASGKPQMEDFMGSIEVRQTPNPNARKFVLAGIHFGPSRNFALGSPVDDTLAAQLLGLVGVYNVLLAQDFVTVNKRPDVAWSPLQSEVESILMDYFVRHATRSAKQEHCAQ
jgi:hypothetical protein